MVVAGLLEKIFDHRCLEGFSNFLESKPPRFLSFLPTTYYTPKFIGVDYWPVALVALLCKAGIAAYLVFSLIVNSTWAYAETPMGTVNAYGGASLKNGSAYLRAAGRPDSEFSYCNNDQHAFMESAGYNYSTPQCKFFVPEQLVVKGKGQVQVITQILENHYRGWPCASANDAAETAACANSSGVKIAMTSGQCLCQIDKTIYPVGVEDIVVSIDHTFSFPVGKFGLDSWGGTSTLTSAEAASTSDVTTSIESEVEDVGASTTCALEPSRTCRTYSAGSSVSLPVGQWLSAAGASLDDYNSLAGRDQMGRDGGQREPFNRMTGMVIAVTIRYHNGSPQLTAQPQVSAHIAATKQLLGWAGPGSQRIHVTYPTGSYGAETFEYIDRYAQGIAFDFEPTGLVYVFNWNYLIQTLTVAFIMLGVAGTITDFVAFSSLPGGHSQVLSSYRFQTVTKRAGFAQLAMSTTLSALNFHAIDEQNNLGIEAEDIVRVLASIHFDDSPDPEVKMDAEKAHALALTILRDQVVSGETKLWKKNGEGQVRDVYSFLDYMGTQDNGVLPFQEFIKRVKMPAGGAMGDAKPSDEEVERCKKAFEEGRRGALGPKAEALRRRAMARKASPGVKASPPATSSAPSAAKV